ncbi:MAG: amidohydrolase family protein [Acidobacteriota bacterium]
MGKRILTILLVITVVGCASGQRRSTVRTKAPDGIVLEDATVIDGTGAKPRPNTVIVIQGDRIREIGPKGKVQYPSGAKIISCKNKYIIPGLFDLHAHITFLRDPDNFTGYDRQTTERVLKILLAYGITTARNPAAPSVEAVTIRNDVRNGKTLGPQIFTAGEPINWSRDRNVEDVRAEVRRQAAIGVDYIKVYARMPPELIQAAVEEAHKLGLKVVGHLQVTTPTQALAVSIDAITHGATWSVELLPSDKRQSYEKRIREVGPLLARIDWLNWVDLNGPEIKTMISAIARAHTPLDPTLIAYVTKFRGRDPRYRNRIDFIMVPKPILETWEGALGYWKEDDFERGAKVWPKVLQLVKAYYDGGVLLTAGSDLPNPWVIPGISLHDELELLGEAGIPALDVIKIATHNSAEGLGVLNNTGTLEVGKRADLVVLNGDPLTDIRNTRKVEGVIMGGKYFDPHSLLRDATIPEYINEKKADDSVLK